MASHYTSPLGGPDDANVRPPKRPGPIAWVVGAIVLLLTIAFLVAFR